MTLADEIRHHVQLRYVEEARRGGRESFSVVAGDVHRDMKLANRMPAVCGALRSKALQSECGITPIGWSGPNQSSTSVATFKFTDVAKHSVAEKDVVGPHGSTTLSTRVDSPTAAWQRFEVLARERMQVHFGQPLHEMELSSVPKRFDMVSIDGSIVGDAKYLSLVAGLRTPPAKFMEIAGHVWLL